MAQKDRPGVVAPPPLIYAAFWVLAFFLFPRPIEVPFGEPIGVAMMGAAALLLVSGFAVMLRARTHIDPFQPTTAIVSSGPFRFTRNPLYLAMTLLYIGLALATDTPWALVLLPVALALMHVGVIAREERYLERKFGEEYLAYKRRVRRWL